MGDFRTYLNIMEGKVNKVNLYEGLTLTEAKSARLWESAGQKLFEAQLTPDQIQKIFASIEGVADNRTFIGKGKDAAASVAAAWNDLKGKIQNTGPIQAFDARYDSLAQKLRSATGGDQGLMRYVQKYRDFAKKHPVMQGFIYAAMIAALGVSGAGVGGAAALGLFKMADRLLQGDKLSSALYKGATTGALAYGAGQLMQYFQNPTQTLGQDVIGTEVNVPDQKGGSFEYTVKKGDTLSDIAKRYNVSVKELMQANDGSVTPGTWGVNTDTTGAFTDLNPAGDYTGIQNNTLGGDVGKIANKIANPDVLAVDQKVTVPGATGSSVYQDGVGTAADTWDKVKSGTYDPSEISRNQAAKWKLPGAGEYVDYNTAKAGANGATNAAASSTPGQALANQAASAASGTATTPPYGAEMSPEYLSQVANFKPNADGIKPRFLINPEQAQQALDWQKQNGGQLQKNGLNESIVKGIFGAIYLNEGMFDRLKQLAGNAGKALTNKVTANQLNKMWEKAGKPLDSQSVIKIMSDAGLSMQTIRAAFEALGISIDPSMDTDQSADAGIDSSAPTSTVEPGNVPNEPENTTNVPPSDTVSSDVPKSPVSSDQPTQEPSVAAATSAADVESQIKALWDSYINTGKAVPQSMRRLIRQMWLDSGGTSVNESKKRKAKIIK